LSDDELTISQFGALEALYHCGPMCQGDLAEKLIRSFGSVTSLLDGLEKREFVSRQRQGHDKRFIMISLTAKGKTLVERILPRHVKTVTERFAALTADQQEQLRRLCRQLGKGH